MSNQIVTSGTISGCTISPNESLTVNANGFAYAILVDGGQETIFGTGSATTIEQGGVLTVSAGVAHSTTVSSGGDFIVVSAGTGDRTTVLNGGTFVALDGGTASNLTISGGGIGFINNGVIATGITVAPGGVAVISSTNTTTVVDGLSVSSGGYAIILPGSGTVNEISGNGTFISTCIALIEPGGSITTFNSSAPDLAVASGIIELVLPGGIAQGGTVDPGANQQIFFGGLATNVVLSQSFQTVSSGAAASGTVVDQGAVQYVYSGGSATATTVNSGGFVMVDSGGLATGVVVNDGGIETVDGAVVDTVVNSGGEESVVFSGSATDTTINSGGYAYILGTASGTQIRSGGYEVVEGEAIGAVVSSGGVLLAGYPLQLTNPPTTGEIINATTVASGGLEVVFAGAIDSGTTVESGGTYVALPGASVFNSAFDPGASIISTGIVLFEPPATITFSSTFSNQSLTSGMSDYVLSSAIESGITIENNAYSEVGSGGTATDTMIDGGGTLSFAPGGLATGSILFAGSGGTLDIQGTLLSGATVSGFAPGDEIDFDAVTGKDSTVTLLAGNTLQVTNGTVTVDLQLDPNQDFSNSIFQIDATNRGAAVTLTPPPLAPSGDGQSTGAGVVPVDIPLYIVPFNSGYKIGIQVSLDGGATYHMYEFDTGGTGFYSAYSPDMAGNFSVVSPAPVVNTYSSGNTYATQVVSTNVSFQTTTGQTVSVDNADIGLITAAQNIDGTNPFSTQNWNSSLTGTPSSPPLQGAFYGDFGLSLRPGLGVDAILPQIAGGLSDGFIINLGTYPNGEYGQIGYVQVGLTQNDISSFTTLISMQGQNTLDTFPYSHQPTYSEALADGTLTLWNSSTVDSFGTEYTFDTGTPTMRIYEPQSDIQPFLDSNGHFLNTTTIGNTSPAAFPDDNAWQLIFQQGSTSGQTEAVTGSGSNAVNTGLNAFFGQQIMFDVQDGLMGFAPSCFATGTRLMTPRGEVVVEALQLGDEVVTLDGTAQRIVWIGHRTIDCLRHPSPHDVLPVRILAHAFGPGMPNRDLFLSPDHALFVEAALIPVKHLLNGNSVAQITQARITYYHVELAKHDVILANGLPAETYLETGCRAAFENNGQVIQAHPIFKANVAESSFHWEAFGYAPLVVAGPVLERVRHKLQLQPTARAASKAVVQGPANPRGRARST